LKEINWLELIDLAQNVDRVLLWAIITTGGAADVADTQHLNERENPERQPHLAGELPEKEQNQHRSFFIKKRCYYYN
jgi:hypothetical protein